MSEKNKQTNKQTNNSEQKTENPGDTPYDGLHGEAPPERGTFFRLQVYERVGSSLFKVYGRQISQSVEKAQKG